MNVIRCVRMLDYPVLSKKQRDFFLVLCYCLRSALGRHQVSEVAVIFIVKVVMRCRCLNFTGLCVLFIVLVFLRENNHCLILFLLANKIIQQRDFSWFWRCLLLGIMWLLLSRQRLRSWWHMVIMKSMRFVMYCRWVWIHVLWDFNRLLAWFVETIGSCASLWSVWDFIAFFNIVSTN